MPPLNKIMRYKVLWVEDNAEADLFQFLAPVNVDGRFDMDIAINATEACSRLNTERYDVIIMDSRIPAGHDPFWKEREANIQRQSPNPIVRLGLEILKIVLRKDERPEILEENKREDKYCIFSIDPKSELTFGPGNQELERFLYEQKKASMPRNVLVTIICRSLETRKQGL